MSDPSVSLAVPVYNEEANVESVVRDLKAKLAGHDYEIILVNDGSVDRTPELADRLATEDPAHVRVIHHPKNLGGGAATRTGLFAGVKDCVAMIPGDGQFKSDDLPRFLEAIKNADFVISRRQNRSGGVIRALNSWCYRNLVRLLLGIKYKHINWVKLYRRDKLQSLNLTSDSWLVDTEILYWASRLGWRHIEFEVEELPRRAGKATGGNPFHMVQVIIELWRFRKHLKQQEAAGLSGPKRPSVESGPPVRAG